MKFYDLIALESILDYKFLSMQGFYVSKSPEDVTSIYQLIKEVGYRNLVPHPLFDRDAMRSTFGASWLINYLNQDESLPVPPSRLVSYDYFASQIYTEVSLHLAIFQHHSISLCPDFDSNEYILIAKNNGFNLFQHIFGDYSFRSNYEFVASNNYNKLFD